MLYYLKYKRNVINTCTYKFIKGKLIKEDIIYELIFQYSGSLILDRTHNKKDLELGL